eukprot:363428-Chlamydomonas_euryale.AAC.3
MRQPHESKRARRQRTRSARASPALTPSECDTHSVSNTSSIDALRQQLIAVLPAPAPRGQVVSMGPQAAPAARTSWIKVARPGTSGDAIRSGADERRGRDAAAPSPRLCCRSARLRV